MSTPFDKYIAQNSKLKDICVTNYQHTIVGAGANNYTTLGIQRKPCLNGAFDFSDPVITGLNITDGYSIEKVKTGAAPTNMPFTGVKETKDGKKRIKAQYFRGKIHGSMTIFDGLDILEERTYNNGVLIQQIFYTEHNREDVIGRFVWIYSYPNPSTSCFSSSGSNAPCKESTSSGPNIAGVSSSQNDGYSLTLQTEDYKVLMVRNPFETIYYFNGGMIAQCANKNGLILGTIKCYDKNGVLSTITPENKAVYSWNEIKDLYDKDFFKVEELQGLY